MDNLQWGRLCTRDRHAGRFGRTGAESLAACYEDRAGAIGCGAGGASRAADRPCVRFGGQDACRRGCLPVRGLLAARPAPVAIGFRAVEVRQGRRTPVGHRSALHDDAGHAAQALFSEAAAIPADRRDVGLLDRAVVVEPRHAGARGRGKEGEPADGSGRVQGTAAVRSALRDRAQRPPNRARHRARRARRPGVRRCQPGAGVSGRQIILLGPRAGVHDRRRDTASTGKRQSARRLAAGESPVARRAAVWGSGR